MLPPIRAFRTPSSELLDDLEIRRRGGELIHVPPARPWGEIYALLDRRWKVGQHFSLFAMTRSGKTTFARAILDIRDWVVVFGTKPRDIELYDGFEKRGYVIKDQWSPSDTTDNRVIFRPGGGLIDTGPQKRAFARAFEEIYEIGGWTIYIDEMLVMADDLGLRSLINRMYTQAASNDVTIVGGSQRPFTVPQNMIQQSEWFGLWRMADKNDRDRAAETLGDLRSTAQETMQILPRYEVMVANRIEGEAWRTKVGV